MIFWWSQTSSFVRVNKDMLGVSKDHANGNQFKVFELIEMFFIITLGTIMNVQILEL
jgi:hypothetical protein